MSSVISYGDLTSAGIGTLTATCGNEDLMFGHPFFWDGKTTMGMNGAT